MVPLTFYSRERDRERDRDGNVSIVSMSERVWRYILDCKDAPTNQHVESVQLSIITSTREKKKKSYLLNLILI